MLNFRRFFSQPRGTHPHQTRNRRTSDKGKEVSVDVIISPPPPQGVVLFTGADDGWNGARPPGIEILNQFLLNRSHQGVFFQQTREHILQGWWDLGSTDCVVVHFSIFLPAMLVVPVFVW